MRIAIGDRFIGTGEPVFIIAEIGVNHNGSIKLAKRMINVAIDAGADAVKFQSYKTDRIIIKSAPSAKYHIRATSNKESWYDLLKRLELSKKKQKELFDYCVKKRIIFLSTPYDTESADLLHKLNVAAYKIASTDSTNIPLLERISRFKKPIILSTGMCTLKEVSESIKSIRKSGNNKIILLQCTANYPPLKEDANLNVLDTFKKKFNVLAGYSDHLKLSQAAIAAVAKGACVYEVHFTLNKKFPGPDHNSSAEPAELRKIIRDIRLAEKLLGSCRKRITASEKETKLKLQKSIVSSCNIRAGELFTRKNIEIKRPGTGLSPKYYRKLLGKKAKKDIKKDELIHFTDIS